MPPKKKGLMDLTFKQIATATSAGKVDLYGLTDDGRVFLLDGKKGYWVPLVMGTPKAEITVRYSRAGSPPTKA